MNLATIRSITAPAAQLLRNMPAQRLTKATRPTHPVEQLVQMAAAANPAKRTYYLGACGRVSQRRHLVGEIVATVRAFTTDHARFLFTEAHVIETKPFIGKPKPEKWHCPDCGRDFLGPVNSIAHPGQNICPGRGCYSRNIVRVS